MIGALGSAWLLSSEGPGDTTVLVQRTEFVGNREPEVWGTSFERYGAVHLTDRSGQGDLDATFEDVVFDDNVGHGIAHLSVVWHTVTTTVDVVLRRTAFYRGDTFIYDPGNPANVLGTIALLFGRANTPPATLTLEDVDFGTGPTANLIDPIHGCPEPLEGLVSGTLLRPGPDCPTP